jgi:hypothetical protein
LTVQGKTDPLQLTVANLSVPGQLASDGTVNLTLPGLETSATQVEVKVTYLGQTTPAFNLPLTQPQPAGVH